jgi:hypothetical protein
MVSVRNVALTENEPYTLGLSRESATTLALISSCPRGLVRQSHPESASSRFLYDDDFVMKTG